MDTLQIYHQLSENIELFNLNLNTLWKVRVSSISDIHRFFRNSGLCVALEGYQCMLEGLNMY